ncbi:MULTISPECIES: condensation domain-containing protein [Streptomyces]|uniref:Thioester reductase n=1 Tax=Streptomyces viridochromogenes TaxID=1938 RepID=A0A0L8J0W9_STRVR|nr:MULTISPECIES: condensation domain-containing protein [Streptomyces]KOG07311.1 thioester reductase [Streptomyces viridochromogenes]
MFPLSASQQIVWLQQKVVPDSRAYHATAVVDFHGEIQPKMLRQCVSDAVGRHDAMRIRICDEGSAIAFQEVVESLDIEIPEYDLRGAEDPEERRAELLRGQVLAEFDLRNAPLARWTLVRLGDGHWQLFMTEHHLVHDGRSTVEFLAGVFRQYAAEVTGGEFVAEAAPSYEEYVAHTNSDEYRARVAADVAWWADRLEGARFTVDFPGIGTRRSALFDHRGGQFRQAVPADLMARVSAAAQEGGHTVFATLLAVYAELCRRHSGQNDLVIGMPFANRPPGFERTVGMMVGAVPLRLAIDPDAPGGDVATEAMEAIFDAIDHESAPIQELVKATKRSSKGLGNPLFNIMFAMHDAPCPPMDAPGLSVDMQIAVGANSTKFDLSVVVMPGKVLHGTGGEHGYELVWEYSTQVFAPEHVELLATGFETLLRAYVAQPHEPIGSLAPTVVAPPADDDRAAGQVPAAAAADVEPPAAAARPAGGGAGSDSLWLQAFRHILERDDIDEDDDFFQVGGYSLLVPMLLSHYESLAGWRPPTSLVFEFSSPLELEAASAEHLRQPSGVQG